MDRKQQLVLILFLLLVALVVVGVILWQRIQYDRTIKALTSMVPQQVTTFRIYPRVGVPFGTPTAFKVPDPMIDEFFQSLTDLRSYSPSHDMIDSQDHEWFLEVVTKDITIPISCGIPSEKGDIVVGQLARFTTNSTTNYGHFQSRKLFEWYQKYSHRWLNPPGEQKEEDKKIRK